MTQSLSHPRTQSLIITIDGPAGVGKSTVAKLLARRLRLFYLDTGATYRALAYEALRRGVDPRRETAVARVAGRMRLQLDWDPARGLRVLLNGRDVTRHIRTEAVTEAAAVIAQHPDVRAVLVRLQRRLASGPRVVAEGRDTGTVVFPHAAYKFFLTARHAVRARRRQMELQALPGRSPTLARIAGQLKARDALDRSRTVGPLVKPPKAIVVDTSRLPAEQVVERMLSALSHHRTNSR